MTEDAQACFLCILFFLVKSILGVTQLIFYITECPEAYYGNLLQSYKILFYM